MREGCGKPDNNGREVSGSKLLCGTKLTFGTSKEPKRTEIHLCRECAEAEQKSHQGEKDGKGNPSV